MAGGRGQKWLALGFAAALAFAVLFGARAMRHVRHLHAGADEPIHGWMTVPYVAHSYHVPPRILYQALGTQAKPPDRRPLKVIAREQNRSMDEVREVLMETIERERKAHPTAPPGSRVAPSAGAGSAPSPSGGGAR